ncbi:hypothetical protein ACPA9J_12830 [Pseudomonas aeruginosa]
MQAYNHQAQDRQRFAGTVERAFDTARKRIAQRAWLITVVIVLGARRGRRHALGRRPRRDRRQHLGRRTGRVRLLQPDRRHGLRHPQRGDRRSTARRRRRGKRIAEYAPGRAARSARQRNHASWRHG